MILGLYYFITDYYFHEFCPFRILTGLPCPACGITRAVLMIFRLDLYDALIMNPTAYLWIIFIIYLLWQRYFIFRWQRFNTLIVIIISIFSLVWFAFRFSQLFPQQEPYTYFNGCLLKRLLKM